LSNALSAGKFFKSLRTCLISAGCCQDETRFVLDIVDLDDLLRNINAWMKGGEVALLVTHFG